jgi:hypothetical protein
LGFPVVFNIGLYYEFCIEADFPGGKKTADSRIETIEKGSNSVSWSNF